MAFGFQVTFFDAGSTPDAAAAVRWEDGERELVELGFEYVGTVGRSEDLDAL